MQSYLYVEGNVPKASLQRAAENLDSAALEQLLHEATRNGIEAAELKARPHVPDDRGRKSQSFKKDD